jgi:hypothetical protein
MSGMPPVVNGPKNVAECLSYWLALLGRDDNAPFWPNFVDDVAHAGMDRDRVLEWLRSRLGWILLHELDESLLVLGNRQWDPHRPWLDDACPRCGRPIEEIDPQRGKQLPP